VLLSHSIYSSGARLGGASIHGEPLQAIPLLICMTTLEPSNWGVKVEIGLILMQNLPLDWI